MNQNNVSVQVTEPMDVPEIELALVDAIAALERGPWKDSPPVVKNARILRSLRARLRREREAIQKVRDKLDKQARINEASGWVRTFDQQVMGECAAALDSILRGEGTT